MGGVISAKRRRPLATATFATALVALVVGLGGDAYGYHRSGTYPSSRGYHQAAVFSDFYGLYIASQNCNTSELNAFDAIRNSTANSSGTFGSRWRSGIRMSRSPDGNACTGTSSAQTDIRLLYLTATQWSASHSTNAGGEFHAQLASSSYCGMIGTDYPCGTHNNYIHINKPKWNITSGAGRVRLLIHETGHGQGLAHHCTSNSIMNDGSSSCNGGAWLNVTGYLATDRSGVVSVYPNWPYP
jgi:hypothetical protein